MDSNLFLKSIIYVLFSILLLDISCINYYDDGFKEDVFTLPSHWQRVMSNNSSVYVNPDGILDINFLGEKYSGAGYFFPFYKSGGIYEISVIARAEKKKGHIFLYGYTYDYMSNITLAEKVVPVAEEYNQYSFTVKMPGKGYILELFFTKDDPNSGEGKLLVKSLKINYKLINFTSIEPYKNNKDNCCFPPYGKWQRWQASEKQAFINADNELEMRFDEKKWISVHYQLPFYKKNTKIMLYFIARANKQKGRLQVYDYTAKKVLESVRINISKDLENYSVKFKSPKEEDHAIWIRFLQNNPKETGGGLFIKRVQINKQVLDIIL